MQCVLQLSSALSFKQQLETADTTLRRFVEHGFLDGTKLVSLDSPELDGSEPTSTANPIMPIEPTNKSTESIDSVHKDAVIPNITNSREILYEKILCQTSATDFKEDELLQPMALTSGHDTIHDLTTENTNFLDDEALATELNYDDDPNTLLQPLEMHQLPRIDDEDVDDKDEYDDDDDEDDEDDDGDDDEAIEDESSAIEDDHILVPSNVSSFDNEPEDMQIVSSSEASDVTQNNLLDESEVTQSQEWYCLFCKITFLGNLFFQITFLFLIIDNILL